MQKYYETHEVVEILGCSATTARRLIQSMPHLRIVRGKGSVVRVKVDDFNKYLEEHTVQPDEFQPRTTPFDTAEAERKAWHKR